MARLYPPVIEEVLPAFCLTIDRETEKKIGASINVSFNLNRAVANAEVGGLAIRMRTVSTNRYVLSEDLNVNPSTGKSEGVALTYNLNEGTATFVITAENNEDAINALRIGQFYRVQLAFIGLTGDIGYWSTVATIKCVAKPSVTIANFNQSDANIFANEIIGEYIQDTTSGDSSEKVYSYRFQLFDSNNNILDDTGVCLHNSSTDVSSNSSTDTFFCYRELNEKESYYIIYSIVTINGLAVSSPKYQVIMGESVEPETDITLVVSNGLEDNDYTREIPDGGFATWYPWEEGLIKIYPESSAALDANTHSSSLITGNFVILRSSSKDNFKTWQEVRRFRLKDEKPSSKVIYDFTVEQGITYRYAIQQYNRQQFYSKKIYSYKRDLVSHKVIKENGSPVFNDITADFEDMFLYDGQKQLKIRFNPKVNSFKNDLQEQKIDTIGSKHPFIFRNGNVCYKEFPISGLISFQQDNALFFIDKDNTKDTDDYRQMNLTRFEANLNQREKGDTKPQIKYLRINDLISLQNAFNNGVQVYKKTSKPQSITSVLNELGHENLQSTKNRYFSDSDKEKIEERNNEKINVIQYERISDYNEAERAFYRNEKIYKQVIESDRPNIIYNKTDLTSENIMSERYFKLAVLDWLTDGKPKLFRSPTEGNYIVRLLNVNLTPKTELGRMIHEFTCTAYEIADFNYESLRDLGLLTITAEEELETQTFSTNFNVIAKNGIKDKEGYYSLNLESKDLVNFECTNFAPGDKVKVLMKDSAEPLYITIGTTGTYIYDEGKIIIGISILPNNIAGDFSRDILFSTQGYTSQPFDTIASISTHTKMGEQIIGPVDNYLEKTNVQQKGSNYANSDNVDLAFKHTRIIFGEDGEGYIPGKYYIFRKGEYIIAEGDFNNANVYYKLEPDGSKLKISEILHLHAKKREVIPIFYNSPQVLPIAAGTAKFSLTPFGQGYIRQKAITVEPEWLEGLGNFTAEELEYERDIHELVDFVISKANKDIFCLFEVYIPANYNQENQTASGWDKYSSLLFSHPIDSHNNEPGEYIYGIYDPWLYEWQLKRNNNEPNNLMGWWPKKNERLTAPGYSNLVPKDPDYGYYNPTIIFDYTGNIDDIINQINELLKYSDINAVEPGQSYPLALKPNGEIYTFNDYLSMMLTEEVLESLYAETTIVKIKNLISSLRVISLDDIEEITLENIQVPKSIKIGNGVILETIYRIQQIDYTIENESSKLKSLRNTYLAIKEEAEKKAIKYRIAQYSKFLGEILKQKYTAKLQEIQGYENYKDIIGTLTNKAREQQIEKLKQYFIQERNLMNNSTSQLRILDLDLCEDLGLIYETDQSLRIYWPEGVLDSIIEEYNNFLNDTTLFTKSSNIYTPKLYEITENENNIITQLNNFLYHIDNSGYNLSEKINDFRNNFYSRSANLNYQLAELGNRRYVSQYLEFLNQKGYDLFFIKVKDSEWKNKQSKFLSNFMKDDLSKRLGNNTEIYKLVYKRSTGIGELQGAELFSPNWGKYFYTNDTDNLHYLNSGYNTDSNGIRQYYITDFPDNESDQLTFLKQSSSSYSFLQQCGIISQIISVLNDLNTSLGYGNGNTNERLAEYNAKYTPVTYNALALNATGVIESKLNEIQLGVISSNNKIDKISHKLEALIDNVYLNNPNIETEDVFDSINWGNIMIPEAFRSKDTDSLNDPNRPDNLYLKQYIKDYINSGAREIYQKICTCVAYYENNIDNLTQEQIDIINTTINNYKTELNYSAFMNRWHFDLVQESYDNRNFGKLYQDWFQAYYYVGQGDQIIINETEFQNLITDYNTIVGHIIEITSQFIALRDRYNSITEQYSFSDNIKEILQDEKESYDNVIIKLDEIKNSFDNQLDILRQNVILQGYLDFLTAYKQSQNENNNANMTKYQELLEEAEIMTNTQVNEEDSPYRQSIEITKAWKNYLDALSDSYSAEVKERFS